MNSNSLNLLTLDSTGSFKNRETLMLTQEEAQLFLLHPLNLKKCVHIGMGERRMTDL